MIPRTEWEVSVAALIGELASGATTVALYGAQHPRAVEALKRLSDGLAILLADTEGELALVLLGDELFVQGRPFTRISPQGAGAVRRLRRRNVEHATFRRGVTADELSGFLLDLAAAADTPVVSREHIVVGRVEVGDRDLGGPDATGGRRGRHALPAVRDRVALVHESFQAVTAGRSLPVADLDAVVQAIIEGLAADPDPLAQCAPWQGEERWPAVHAHNVAALSLGVALLGGVAAGAARDIGVAALLHDIGKLFLPADLLERELALSGSEVELILDHPREALALLLPVGTLPPLAVIVAYEHHLSYNGSGYPRLSRPRRPHPAARLVAVCDALDVLGTARASHGLATRESTIAFLREHAGTRFDPAICEAVTRIAEHR